MKIDIYKLYIVFKPGEDSEKADIFQGEYTTIEELMNMSKGGMRSDEVYAIFTTLKEAEETTKKLMIEHNIKE